MKLTPMDIRQQRYNRVWRGYQTQEVDSFQEQLAQQWSEVLREMQQLRASHESLESRLKEYRERESNLREAMLTAQRAIDEIREQARKEADVIISEAELNAEKIVEHGHQKVVRMLDELRELRLQKIRLVEDLRGVVNTHQKLLMQYDEGISQEREDMGKVFPLSHRVMS